MPYPNPINRHLHALNLTTRQDILAPVSYLFRRATDIEESDCKEQKKFTQGREKYLKLGKMGYGVINVEFLVLLALFIVVHVAYFSLICLA